MTYVFSDAELNALVGLYGIMPESISPYKASSESKTKKNFNSLLKLGLVENSHNEYYLSEDGRTIADLLAAPGLCVKFIKKTDSSSVTVFADDPDQATIWCVCIRTALPAVNVLRIFPSAEAVVAFLRKEVFQLKTEFNEDVDIDVFLTYEEWLMFSLSQLCYMRLQTAGEEFFDSENEYITDTDIYSAKFAEFLVSDTDVSAEYLASEENRNSLYAALCAKGIFEKHPSEEAYKYSDTAKLWLDNDVAYDSVKVEYSKVDGSAYSLMLTLRVNGVTSMKDTGDGVRILSSRTIPFGAYLS